MPDDRNKQYLQTQKMIYYIILWMILRVVKIIAIYIWLIIFMIMLGLPIVLGVWSSSNQVVVIWSKIIIRTEVVLTFIIIWNVLNNYIMNMKSTLQYITIYINYKSRAITVIM